MSAVKLYVFLLEQCLEAIENYSLTCIAVQFGYKHAPLYGTK